jgi:ech hydrogenase subunit D
MTENQENIKIEINELLKKVSELKSSGFRLVQIGCTFAGSIEINYSFDRDYRFINLKLYLASLDTEIPSISPIFSNAFLYENEMHDLFGIKVTGVAIDYQGNFYRLAVKYPFRRETGEQTK